MALCITWLRICFGVTTQGGQGDASPQAGARGVPANISLCYAPPQAARERFLSSYVSDMRLVQLRQVYWEVPGFVG
jgi:hypothetical protein